MGNKIHIIRILGQKKRMKVKVMNIETQLKTNEKKTKNQKIKQNHDSFNTNDKQKKKHKQK